MQASSCSSAAVQIGPAALCGCTRMLYASAIAAIFFASMIPPVLPMSGWTMSPPAAPAPAEAVAGVEPLPHGDRHQKLLGDLLQGVDVERVDRLLEEHDVRVLHQRRTIRRLASVVSSAHMSSMISTFGPTTAQRP